MTESQAAQLAPRVAELHAAGHGRNEIARQLQCAPGTVTAAARIAGVSFAQAVPAEVQEAAATTRQKTTAERREAYAQAWGAVQSRALMQLVKALDSGEDIPPARLATIAAIAGDKWLKLTPEADLDAARTAESRQALNDLHNAILQTARDLATPDELAVMDAGTSPDDPEDDGPRLRPGGEFY